MSHIKLFENWLNESSNDWMTMVMDACGESLLNLHQGRRSQPPRVPEGSNRSKRGKPQEERFESKGNEGEDARGAKGDDPGEI